MVKSMEIKERIRKEILQKRNQLTQAEVILKSDIITNKMRQLKEWKEAENVLLYADFRNEVMTDKLILYAILDNKKVYLPKIEGNDMSFYRIYSLEELCSGYMGIREPIDSDFECFHTGSENSICITPGAAFDSFGARIGYGKGYYDRFLARNRMNAVTAVAYELQIQEKLPSEREDYRVQKIVTEERIIECACES